MAWFMTKVGPNLVIRCADGRVIAFRDAEYRTGVPSELAALRADSRVHEVKNEQEALPILRPWAVNLTTGIMHDVVRRRSHCCLSDELIAAASTTDGPTPTGGAQGRTIKWKLYRRQADALRWNPNARECKYCIEGQ